MRNAKRIAGRIAAWAWGKDVFYTDSGTCDKRKAKSVPTWDGACAGCRPVSTVVPPADPRLGGKKPWRPDPLDALRWLVDDLTSASEDVDSDTGETLDSMENARRVIDAEDTGTDRPGVQITGDPQTRILTL